MSVSFINYLWIIIQFIVGYNLVFPLLLFILSTLKKNTILTNHLSKQPDYAIIVTAYEQTNYLCAVVESILKLSYQNFTVYIVADNCDVSNLIFKDIRIHILRPVEPLQSNVKSHFYAIRRFIKNHERLTIIDSDNLVDKEYLNELNQVFDFGYQAVQGPRIAKNLNTNVACLDAARDIYYQFYDGKLLFTLGSSATLAGSGMAFQTDLYRDCMNAHRDLNGAGFDKVLQAEIVRRNLRIAFAEKAIVYDEKTMHSQQLINQRARWISTWFRYFKYGFTLIRNGLRNRSINQFLFGIVLLRPPLFMFLLCSIVCAMIDLVIQPFCFIFWMVGLLLFVTGFYIALLKSDTKQAVFDSLKNIPVFMFYQVAALFRVGNQKENIATRHAESMEDIK